jgi:hypothetical protein
MFSEKRKTLRFAGEIIRKNRRKEMEILKRFFEEYATAFLYLCLSGICTLLCSHLRRVQKEKHRRKTIRKTVAFCFSAILKNPKEKDAALLQKEAEEALLETLRSRGIGLSHIEARLLLEQESAKKR